MTLLVHHHRRANEDIEDALDKQHDKGAFEMIVEIEGFVDEGNA